MSRLRLLLDQASIRPIRFGANHEFIPKRTRNNGRPIIDRSKVPVLKEEDIEEAFTGGSGPGGQKVNKATNCCQLKHKPSGLVIKVHQSRSLEENRKIAREILLERLDNLCNGEDSVASQKRQIALRKIATQDSLSEKRRNMKEDYKKKLAEKDSRGDDGDDEVSR